MKKLTKLSINPEKVIKNDELLTLRGGYDETRSTWVCKIHHGDDVQIVGYINLDTCDYGKALSCCGLWNANEAAGSCTGYWDPEGIHCY